MYTYTQNPQPSQQVLEILQASRYDLVRPKRRPFLAVPAFKLEYVATESVGTAAVDSSWRFYYNEEFILKAATDPQLGGVPSIAAVTEHELWHLLRKHADRASAVGAVTKAQLKMWNWACDIEIHSDEALAAAIRTTGVEPLTPQYFNFEPHQLAEVYYSKLLDNISEHGEDQGGEYIKIQIEAPEGATPPGGGAQDQDDEGGDEGEGGGGGGGGDEDEDEGEGVGGGGGGGSVGSGREKITVKVYVDPDEPTVGAGDCGSAATGEQAPWEDAPSGRVSDDEADMARVQVAQSIEEWAKQAGEGVGSQSYGGIIEWSKQLLHPKVAWQRILRSAVRSAVAWVSGQTEYSRRRFSRRQAAMPHVVLPGMVHPTPEIAVVMDASASMFRDGTRASLYEEAMAEVGGILKKFGSTIGVTVYSVDSAVGWASRIYSASQLRGIGGGGTNMGVGIDAAAKAKPKPQVIIVITDGETKWPERGPHGIKTVVAIVGQKDRIIQYGDPPPPWAWKVIWID